MAAVSVRPRSLNKLQLISRLFYLGAVLGAIGMVAFVIFQPITVLPRITLSPGFALTDQNGQQLTNEDLRGHLTLYNFTYMSCVQPCPETNSVMANVQTLLTKLDTGNIPVDLVTISIDAKDTPEILQLYSQMLGADSAQWHLTTSTPDRVRWVVGGGFAVFYKELEEGAIKFDPAFMLVDGSGIIRAEYRTATPDMAIIERDINLLLQEAENIDGPSRYAYEAAHLFLCYPR
ncbi:MAG: SCO family protein [Chloroflexi bacterium]|nr:SCO family protein [Chloroflexota bacterium]